MRKRRFPKFGFAPFSRLSPPCFFPNLQPKALLRHFFMIPVFGQISETLATQGFPALSYYTP